MSIETKYRAIIRNIDAGENVEIREYATLDDAQAYADKREDLDHGVVSFVFIPGENSWRERMFKLEGVKHG